MTFVGVGAGLGLGLGLGSGSDCVLLVEKSFQIIYYTVGVYSFASAEGELVDSKYLSSPKNYPNSLSQEVLYT